MGHITNEAHRGIGYRGMGHIGNRAHGHWGQWVQGVWGEVV